MTSRHKFRANAPRALERLLDTTAKINKYFSSITDQTIILFADLVGSTLYKQEHGFVAGLAKTRYHNTTVADIVSEHHGTVVKFIGDGVLCRWNLGRGNRGAHHAINSAIKIFESFDKDNLSIRNPVEKLETRIGMAAGVVADFYVNDPQGSTVDLAARIQSAARPGQILVHRSVVEATDKRRVASQAGKMKGFTGNEYISKYAHIRLKGFVDPQQVAEIRWKDSFVGILEPPELPDLWEDYQYNAMLFSLPPSIGDFSDRYFGICFDLKYKTVLRKTAFHFVCVDKTEDFDATIRDESLFARYMLPRMGLGDRPISELFDIVFAKVNEIELRESPLKTIPGPHYFCRSFSGLGLGRLVGRKVTIHYQLRTVIAKRGNFFAMTTENPIRGLTMTFDMGATPIRRVRPVDYFGIKKAPMFVYSPDRNNPKKIELHVEEPIPPHGGVVFVWSL